MPRARDSDPDTSHAAARDMTAERLRQFHQIILSNLNTFNGLVTREIAYFSKKEFSTISPRMVELEEMGLVERTKERRKPTLPRSRSGIVWKITDRGRFVLQQWLEQDLFKGLEP